MECSNKKTPLPVPKKSRRCRFLGGDDYKQDGGGCAFTGEQLRFPSKLRRYVCARCGMLRGEHRHAGIKEVLLPPRKRFRLRRVVQLKARKQEKRERLEDGEIWTGRAVKKGKRAPRRKPVSVAWAGLKLRA